MENNIETKKENVKTTQDFLKEQKEILEYYEKQGKPPPIGLYFVVKGKLTQEQLNVALAIQRKVRKRLGRILVDLGFISYRDLIEYLSKYNPDALVEEKLIQTALEKDFLLKYKVVVLSETQDLLLIATLNPKAKEILENYLQKKVEVKEISLPIFWKELNQLKRESKDLPKDPNALINYLIKNAWSLNASDIHLEVILNCLVIRYRIDGVLRVMYVLEKALVQPLFARIKGKANLDIVERRLPQDGSFTEMVSPVKEIQIRVSTLPTAEGDEAIVLRLLDKDKITSWTFQDLGIEPIWYEKIIRNKTGLVLVCGETGSGKTTTLYVTILHLDKIGKNIITIEDPVEYHFPFIRQVQVNRAVGLDFAKFLRATLRQDPDIILVGEVRDEETAQILVQAAETGHLVFATLHANDIPTVIARLRDLGVRDTDLKFLLKGIQVQTLIRKLCPACLGEGCEYCGHSGYKGRVLVTEVTDFDEDKWERFIRGERWWKPMIEKALELALKGITDLREVERVFGKIPPRYAPLVKKIEENLKRLREERKKKRTQTSLKDLANKETPDGNSQENSQNKNS